ncbi:MAG: PQQ-dependent sugar dehydrogenase, partial [Candidatus Binatia bacterium]
DAGPQFPSYSGWIDELRISNRVRYSSSFTPPAQAFKKDDATKALYHLDEGAGDVIRDSSGASGGPSNGVRRFGGSPPGPEWSAANPFWPLLAIEPFVDGLDRPVHVTHTGDGSGRLFVVEQPGRIRIVSGGAVVVTPFLDISSLVGCCGERGLLSVAFPPSYGESGGGRFYIDYTDLAGHTVIARYRVSGNTDLADAASAEILLTVNQPFANHNGGQIEFGPDGHLYVGMGDGGSSGDPQNNAQNKQSRLGKLLRLDVESGVSPFAIPPDNPYVGTTGDDLVWALGLRNPWRFSFDRLTGDLYIGDVGQQSREEIDFQPAAATAARNYGWRILEGNKCFKPSSNCTPPAGYAKPIAEYDHAKGCSVTGGFVYRGAEFPAMEGRYFYGDYCSGRIWGLKRSGASSWVSKVLLDTTLRISSFGEDEAGELYVVNHDGAVLRLVDLSE